MTAKTGSGAAPSAGGDTARRGSADTVLASAPSEPQAARAVLMIRPKRFGANVETAGSNRFQSPPDAKRRSGAAEAAVAAAALAEFDALAGLLERTGIDVHVVAGKEMPTCPDEVFPNNWFSTHADGTLVRYPMLAPSRRLERRDDLEETLRGLGYRVQRIVDLTALESRGLFLEGTGSLVLDRAARTAFACSSARTSLDAVEQFCARMGYEALTFDAVDRDGHPIYHTNVMMSVGTPFALVCTEAIRDPHARERVLDALDQNGKRIVEIGYPQLHAFAGNLLELDGSLGTVIALSQRAFGSLEPAQRAALEQHGALVPAPIDTIETFGGGSVRCMLAEVHLPRCQMKEA